MSSSRKRTYFHRVESQMAFLMSRVFTGRSIVCITISEPFAGPTETIAQPLASQYVGSSAEAITSSVNTAGTLTCPRAEREDWTNENRFPSADRHRRSDRGRRRGESTRLGTERPADDCD